MKRIRLSPHSGEFDWQITELSDDPEAKTSNLWLDGLPILEVHARGDGLTELITGWPQSERRGSWLILTDDYQRLQRSLDWHAVRREWRAGTPCGVAILTKSSEMVPSPHGGSVSRNRWAARLELDDGRTVEAPQVFKESRFGIDDGFHDAQDWVEQEIARHCRPP